MAIAPRAALFDFGAFVIHVTAGKIVFDHARDRAVFHKCREDFDRHAQIGNDADNVRLSGRDLQFKGIRAVERLTVRRGEADSHAGRNEGGILRVGFEFDGHGVLLLII